MAFIRVQNLVKDENGLVTGGSAQILESIYVSGVKNHSRQSKRECLGKVIWLSDDGKEGIFLSPVRGLVGYNSASDAFFEVSGDDRRVAGNAKAFPEPLVHTVFGDAYLFLSYLEKEGFLAVLKAAFPEKGLYERLLSHLLHTILKDGSRIGCDDFIAKSFFSYLTGIAVPTLKTDSPYFTSMGDDRRKLAFFKAFVAYMRARDKDFGKGVYVDSTPLPNDIDDNPFNAFCSHGLAGGAVQSRLVLVLDQDTGFPVWFSFINGNVLDVSTTDFMAEDVRECLGIEIVSYVLDAGYPEKGLFRKYGIGSDKTLLVRMPDKKGYPFRETYRNCRTLFSNAKYVFCRGSHDYFGVRREVELFGSREYAYVFLDKLNAELKFNKWLRENGDDFGRMTDKEKNWRAVKDGFFILVANYSAEPQKILADYYGRTDIEGVFKTSKDFAGLLPLNKWNVRTVGGKILNDVISTIIILMLRDSLRVSKKDKKIQITTSEVFGRTQSWICLKQRNGELMIDVPRKQARECYEKLMISIPSSLKLDDVRKRFLL